MKTCTRCGESKDKNAFYRDKNREDGRNPQCKACARVYDLSPAGRERKHRFAASEKGLVGGRTRAKKYRSTEKGRVSARARSARYDPQYRATHKLEIEARRQVNTAVRGGKLVPAKVLRCTCGVFAAEYHHPDYDKPLEVVAVCTTCHAALGES